MKFLGKITDKILGDTIKESGNLIDNLTVSDEEKSNAKKQLTEVITNALSTIAEAQAEVLKVELSGNWIQRSWRPIVMLTFTAIIVVGAFKTIPYLEDNSPFWTLLEIGLGGYVIGRSVEKVASKVTENIDLPFLKKKDRKPWSSFWNNPQQTTIGVLLS